LSTFIKKKKKILQANQIKFVLAGIIIYK